MSHAKKWHKWLPDEHGVQGLEGSSSPTPVQWRKFTVTPTPQLIPTCSMPRHMEGDRPSSIDDNEKFLHTQVPLRQPFYLKWGKMSWNGNITLSCMSCTVTMNNKSQRKYFPFVIKSSFIAEWYYFFLQLFPSSAFAWNLHFKKLCGEVELFNDTMTLNFKADTNSNGFDLFVQGLKDIVNSFWCPNIMSVYI